MATQLQPEQGFSERVPPQDLEAEQSVLGACLIDEEAGRKVQALLTPDQFYSVKHREIFEAVVRAIEKDGKADLVTVQGQLRRPGRNGDGVLLEEVGGLPYLTGVINKVPTTANVELYAAIVARKAQLRGLQEAARKTIDECYEADAEPQLVVGNMQGRLDKVGRASARPGLQPIAGRIGAYAIRKYQNRNIPNTDWIPSRFPGLREKCPFLRREMTLLVGASGGGKTTEVIAEVDFLAKLGYEVAFFELEMADEQIFDKLIAQSSRTDLRAIRTGALTDTDWLAYQEHGRRFDNLPNLHLNTYTQETMSSIRWQVLKLKAERGVDVVVIDFLDRTADTPEKGEREERMIARLAGMGYRLAREANCHVIILYQLDVRVMSRSNPIPNKGDLANAKTNLVAWCDNIVAVTQPLQAKWDGRSKPPAIYGVPCTDKRWENVAVLSIVKGRFSPEGTLVPVFTELNTGFMGSLQKPWPWHIKCRPEGEDKAHEPGKECSKGKECAYKQVGVWDEHADKEHFAAMKAFKEQTGQTEQQVKWW